MTIPFYLDLLLGFIIFIITIPVIHVTNYIILNLSLILPLFIHTFAVTIFLALAFIVMFSAIYLMHLIHRDCKGKGCLAYFSLVWNLWCIIPFGIKLVIYIRFILFTFNGCESGIENLLASGIPTHSDFTNILNPTEPTGSNPSTGPGGPEGNSGGGHLPPGGTEATQNSSVDWYLLRDKINSQARTFPATRRVSIYSSLHSAATTLTPEERQELGYQVIQDELNGNNGNYYTMQRRTSVATGTTTTELRVVQSNIHQPGRAGTGDVYPSANFLRYLEKFPVV